MQSFTSTARRSLVFVVDGDRNQRTQLAEVLKPYYDVREFGDWLPAAEAIEGATPPYTVLIDEDVPPDGGMRLLERLYAHTDRARVSFVCTANRANTDFFALGRGVGAVATFTKPIKRGALIDVLNGENARQVRNAWTKTLDATPLKALTKTVDTFNSISEKIDRGEPLPYGEVRESCEPLIEAVRNNNYKQMLSAVRGHDDYSYVHSLRVATLLSLFGHTIGIKGDDLLILATGGLLHDIGKSTIPFEVLNKPGKLEVAEFEVMKSHVIHSIDYIDASPGIPRPVRAIAAQHHEKLDGTGYPHGLKGPELNDLSRMTTIVDIFSALTDRRVYKEPMPAEKALDIMESMGAGLDQTLLTLFRGMLLDAAAEDDTDSAAA